MSWEIDFVARLAETRLEHVFNPYSDRCMVHDLVDAAAIRRGNLAAVLSARRVDHIESIWFGRDLGYRGGRRTGLALTDEVTMLTEVERLDEGMKIAKATQGTAVAERTAAVIWSVIRRMRHKPLLWNAFPLHPHEPGDAFTNRAHTVRERRMTVWAIEALIERFNKPRLVAIGNDASKALTDLGLAHELVRHPSYGGQRDFIERIESIHELLPAEAQRTANTLF